ncbi:hypothetical protein [Planctomycetes bacterium Pan216]|uniref:hypothetical protein n=1 Tax=Kolteria novifilia TaxID=2527975 RepID=UPI0011A8268D
MNERHHFQPPRHNPSAAIFNRRQHGLMVFVFSTEIPMSIGNLQPDACGSALRFGVLSSQMGAQRLTASEESAQRAVQALEWSMMLGDKGHWLISGQ